ncbi:cytochrome P450 [Hysterangium stoloniferum]|nr:cytochrome P450 [Hysterangium stoloniferum]
MALPIPQPPTIPFLGNAYLVDKEVPLRSFMLLAKAHGPRVSIFVSSLELVDQVCDQQRFHKGVRGALREVRHLTGDGLFTAFHGEQNWGIAHRILMPAFGPGKIRGMFPAMTDIAQQLVDKWTMLIRFGPDYVIEPTEDFTRLTFDTISLCAMSHRLNSFYSLEMVPFIKAMGSFLTEASHRSSRPALIQNYLSRTANAQFETDQKIMLDLTNEIILKRKQSGVEIDDLLGLMLTAKDPVTGLGLSDENIAANLVTFLIAGHETTSGLLSFTVSHLLNNPTAYAKVRDEVDEVLGKEPIKPEHLGKLTYITAVLREVLRLTPSVPLFTVQPFEETTLTSNGKEYKVPFDVGIQIITAELHRDTNTWGEDADKFRPERMLDGGFERAPKNAWKPWGNGARACIGRPLAWQEALIAVACIFQKFDLVLHDPSYQLHLKSTLTIKPANLHIRAIPRENGPMHIHTGSTPVTTSPTSTFIHASLTSGIPLYLAYGSNSGTCKDFAQRVGTEAPAKGFNPHVVSLDTIEANIPTDGPLIIFTASYEGEPADNAGRFVEALKRGQKGEFANVRFAVFGCGHHDWVQTYQKIPTLVDKLLGEWSAQRLMDRVAADSGADDFFEIFDNWVPKLWERLGEAYGEKVHTDGETRETLSVQVNANIRPLILGKEETSGLGKVIFNRVLTKPGAPAKHHVEIALPENITYQSGDYLSVLPRNPAESVKRVLSRFALLPDQEIIIKSTAATTLPTNNPVSVSEVLAGYVEISQTATRKNMHELQKFSTETVSAKLESLLADYKNEVFDKHISVLDILELYPDISIPFASFLRILPAMRIRQYSISSSPLWNPTHVTLTLSVVEEPASSGLPTRFLGVASNYLANVCPGDPIHVGVRTSASTFHLPQDLAVPVVMFAAGSGIAPMRGFMQERAIQAASGQKVGKTVLFYGCRSPDEDFLYSEDDLKEWEKLDFVEIKPAFSRALDKSCGTKYVQDRVWHDRDLITECYDAGAKFYTCGSPPIANGIKEVVLKLVKHRHPTWDDERIARSWDIIQKDRMATDVFA